MPLTSMTGFGSASRSSAQELGAWRLDVEIRSVNARFLELKIRQPFGAATEVEIRRQVEARVGRGRVDVQVQWSRETDPDADALRGLGVEPRALAGVLDAVQQTQRLAASKGLELSQPNALDIFRFLATSSRGSTDVAPAPPPFLADAIGEALEQLSGFRRAEGQALTSVLTVLADDLERALARLAALLPGERARLQARLTERVAALCAQAEIDRPQPERIDQEIAIVVARGDIEEELARLESHLAQMRATLEGETAKGQGRTLDFLAQELLREVTTIGSKITSHEGSRLVIEAKGIVERIREQVQNVE